MYSIGVSSGCSSGQSMGLAVRLGAVIAFILLSVSIMKGQGLCSPAEDDDEPCYASCCENCPDEEEATPEERITLQIFAPQSNVTNRERSSVATRKTPAS